MKNYLRISKKKLTKKKKSGTKLPLVPYTYNLFTLYKKNVGVHFILRIRTRIVDERRREILSTILSCSNR